MIKNRFVYYEHKGADYILDTPNTELDFIEMLGDTLEPEEIVDKLNELNDENKELKVTMGEMEDYLARMEEENKELKQSNKDAWNLIRFIYNEIKEDGSMDWWRIQDLVEFEE